MRYYDYEKQVANDVEDYIRENITLESFEQYSFDELANKLEDEMWTADSVTGNGSGSYTCSNEEAHENLFCNLDLLAEACRAFDTDIAKLLEDGAEACDVTIRCYLMPRFVYDKLSEYQDELKDDDDYQVVGVCECCGDKIFKKDTYTIIDGNYYCDYCGGEDGQNKTEEEDDE